jgi:cytoskeletal protein RodZ
MHINKDNHELVEEIKSVIDLRQSIELEINTIAQKTKISRGTIKNIENLEFDKLPPYPMNESFISQYLNEVRNYKKN